MFRRLLMSALAAALTVVVLPSPSYAMVSSTPQASTPSFNSLVRVLAHRGSTVYVGGDFTRVTDANGIHKRHGAAAYDVNTGLVLPWNPKVKGSVHDLAVAKEGVYLVGDFTKVKRTPRHNIARVARGGKAKLARNFHPSANDPVNTVALAKHRVFFGGDFTRLNGKARVRLGSVNRGAPFALNGWTPEARRGTVLDLVRTKAGVYVAGEFRRLNDRNGYQRIALVNGKNGDTVLAFNPPTHYIVLDIEVRKTRVYAAVGGPGGGDLDALNRADGARLWQRRFDGDAQAVEVMNGVIYVGGHFSNVCATSDTDSAGMCTTVDQVRRRGASFDAAGTLTGWDPAGDSPLGITTLATFGKADRLAVGGDFTSMRNGTVLVRRYALFNGV